ncbi:MAG: pyridoxal-phosphate dependent enzyme, partial [Gammaproteobacteria bacterium]|nr:pyridoxal-phosphate dependent enzyme [Gammaproteobacteria bacterium]
VMSLSADEISRGVATHSSGNHGAALTRAAALRNGRAWVVMPENSSAAKRAAVRQYGGEVISCGTDQRSREETLARLVAEENCVVIPPFDDYRVIAGQGTAALELLDQAGPLDAVVAPVGGGGLLSGSAVAVSESAPETRVFGAEPSAVDDAFRSLEAGRILPVANGETIADGLRTTVGALTFPIIRERVEGIVCVEETEIVAAMRLIWERMKILIEPSAAVPLAALIRRREAFRGLRVGVILSGGNVDLEALPWT